MTELEKFIPSTDGIHKLYTRVFVPEGEIRGIFQIVHGMTEHIDRYVPLLTLMAENGYVAFGHNHLGHKNTATDEELGFIAPENGHQLLIDDTARVGEVLRAEYPDVPHILFGHSMGSFVARLASQKMSIQKLIICGTGGPNPAASMGIGVCKAIKALRGGRHISKLVYALAFGSYNKHFEKETIHDWLSVDRENIRIYEADPYCTFFFTVSAMQDLITLILRANQPAWFKNTDKELPILLIAGKDDPVGNYGKGVETVYNRLKKKGCQASMMLYDGRHEILNDTCKQEVLSAILSFITG